MKVYLDYAATGPIKPAVGLAIKPYLREIFGNPSSIHQWGQLARQAIDEARQRLAQFLNCADEEIIFTSGGTEADNLALQGVVNYKLSVADSKKPHIITSQIEHHAVLKTCQELEKTGRAKVNFLKPSREGLIDLKQVQEAIKKNTILISIHYVNNELGTIQPIREIGKMIEKVNSKRLAEGLPKIYFHTDAVQAVEYLPMGVDYLHVDLLALSGHKIGATKGIGALYLRKGIPLDSLIFGGEQEMAKRAGTENVIGIVALGKAIELITKDELRIAKIKNLRDYFIKRVLKEIPEAELNGSLFQRSPNNANFYFNNIEGESILLNLDLAGIAASSGSACASQSLAPSHVIVACYGNPLRAHGSVRFSLGQETNKEQIDYAVLKLKNIVKRLRKISPLKEKNNG